MKVFKKIIIVVLCIAIVFGGSAFGYLKYQKNKDSKRIVDVVPVSLMAQENWEDAMQIDGVVQAGNSQNVYLDDTKLVKEVCVKSGDVVKPGDVLLTYDMTVLELDVRQKENQVNVAAQNIIDAQKELARLKTLKPIEDLIVETETTPATNVPVETTAPVETIPSVNPLEVINDNSNASGEGTYDSPFIFACSPETKVTKEFLTRLVNNTAFAEFDIYTDNESITYKWIVDGSSLKKTELNDWIVGTGVSIDSQSGEISFNSVHYKAYGTFSVFNSSTSQSPAETEPEFDEAIETMSSETETSPFGKSEDYSYSRNELAKMISDKQNQIQTLILDKKSAELNYAAAKQQQLDGNVVSKIAGTVTKAGTSGDTAEKGSAFIAIQGEGGISISASIGELNLDKVAVGNKITVNSYESGTTTEAVITAIDNVPTAYTSSNWNENPNSSTYTFTAKITDIVDMKIGEWVSVTIPNVTSSDENGLYIPIYYVHEEDGKYYVMKADENNRLKKEYIKTGKIIYGSLIEIKSGLSNDDKICFPYGKDVKEGVKTKDSDEVLWGEM